MSAVSQGILCRNGVEKAKKLPRDMVADEMIETQFCLATTLGNVFVWKPILAEQTSSSLSGAKKEGAGFPPSGGGLDVASASWLHVKLA